MIVKNLRAGAAGAGIAHCPEIGLGAHAGDAISRYTRLRTPQVEGFVIRLEHGDPQPVLGNAQLFRDELPSESNRIALEVVAETEIAQHLEKRVVAGRIPDVFKIIVLAAGTHAALRRHRSRIGPLLLA